MEPVYIKKYKKIVLDIFHKKHPLFFRNILKFQNINSSSETC